MTKGFGECRCAQFGEHFRIVGSRTIYRLRGIDYVLKRILLGTTSQFVFLFDAASGRVDVHPIENIHGISFDAPASE